MALTLVGTGIPGLDTVLGGGIPRGTALMIVGAPGSGKTILALQLCFGWMGGAAHGAEGVRQQHGAEGTSTVTRALYFSTLSEPHDKLIEHTESLGFFKRELLGTEVELISLQGLIDKGLEGMSEAIVREVRRRRPSLVVIDGYAALQAIRSSRIETRKFVAALSSQLNILGTTLVITIEYSPDDPEVFGEFTTADSVIALTSPYAGGQRKRRLEVRKSRGVRALDGLHGYEITDAGIVVYPRLEALIRNLSVSQASLSYEVAEPLVRVPVGKPELDQMLFGGLPRGSATLLAGSIGVGKTLLGLSFLAAGLENGEPGIYIGFKETAAQLLSKGRRFGLALDKYLDSNLLTLHIFPPVELDADKMSTIIRQEVERTGARRLVLDAINQIEIPAERDGRLEDYAAALHAYLGQQGVTSLLLIESSSLLPNALTAVEAATGDSPLAIVCENVIILRYVTYGTSLYRVMAVVKMRDSDHDRTVREFTIEEQTGLKILGVDSSDMGMLDAMAEELDSHAGGPATGTGRGLPEGPGLGMGRNRPGFKPSPNTGTKEKGLATDESKSGDGDGGKAGKNNG